MGIADPQRDPIEKLELARGLKLAPTWLTTPPLPIGSSGCADRAAAEPAYAPLDRADRCAARKVFGRARPGARMGPVCSGCWANGIGSKSSVSTSDWASAAELRIDPALLLADGGAAEAGTDLCLR